MTTSDAILTRLKLCNDEIITTIGSGTAHKLPPTADVPYGNLPVLYAFLPEFDSISSNSETAADKDVCVLHLLVMPVEVDQYSGEVATVGISKGIVDAQTYLGIIRSYYNDHRQLHTTGGQRNLAWLTRDIDIAGRLVVGLVAFDDETYIGAEVTLTVYHNTAITRSV